MNTRQEKILEILKLKKKLPLDYLCKILCYSHSTIRRDLILLEEMGLVKREKGSVQLLISNSKEKHFKLRNTENIKNKQLICDLAKDFITDGMSIFLDSSSTALQLCPLLSHYKNITIVTNGIEIAYNLLDIPSIEIFMAGGYIRAGSSAIIGEPAIDYIKQFNLDLCILSCTGVDKKGFYEPSLQQSTIKKYMMENANLCIMLCDSSKFNQKYKFTLTGYDQVDYLVTDLEPDPSISEVALLHHCEVVYPK